MKNEIRKQIEDIKRESSNMIGLFEFEEGLKRIPTEQEINRWAMMIDCAMLTDSKRVRSEALELTMWMSESKRNIWIKN